MNNIKFEKKNTEIHGQKRSDPYFELRQKKSPKTREYLDRENERAEKLLEASPVKELKDKLTRESLARFDQNYETFPVKDGPYYYYQKSIEGLSYDRYYRKKSLNNSESQSEMLLDENTLAKEHEYFELGYFEMSPDHKVLAYGYDTTGEELYDIYLRDLASSSEDRLAITAAAAGGLEWSRSQRYLFFTTVDEKQRVDKLKVLDLSNKQITELYHEKDESFNLGISKSKSDRFIFINTASSRTSEYFFIDLDSDELALREFLPRKTGVEFQIYHEGQSFLVLTNNGHENFHILRAPIEKTSWDKLEVIITPSNPHCQFDQVQVFKDHTIITGIDQGQEKIWVYTQQTLREVGFSEEVFELSMAEMSNFEEPRLILYYSSPKTPETTYELDLNTLKLKILQQRKVFEGFCSENYKTERLYAEGHDGKKIPVSLFYKKDLALDGSAPCMVEAYGAYGMRTETGFSHSQVSVVDRGVIVAVAHVRGGDEMGQAWRHDGKLENKINSMKDLISVCEHLSDKNYCDKNKITGHGGSAGGLLFAATINLRPDLFRSVILDVPFVDALNSMLDDSLPLTIGEYEEWGNPQIEKDFYTIKAYCPYENLKEAPYPSMLVTAGFNDPRVGYWEPAKYVAKLRALNNDAPQVILKTNFDSGHFGKTGIFDKFEEIATHNAFLLSSVGVIT